MEQKSKIKTDELYKVEISEKMQNTLKGGVSSCSWCPWCEHGCGCPCSQYDDDFIQIMNNINNSNFEVYGFTSFETNEVYTFFGLY